MKFSTLNIENLENLSRSVVKMAHHYHNIPNKELSIDLILYGIICGRFGQVVRQYRQSYSGSSKPKRIDFRIGGTNPALIEFAIRSTKNGGELYGSQNRSELKKLTRIGPTKAKMRILLLLDISKNGIKKRELKKTYDSISAGQGNFKRWSVRILYVHLKFSYNFIWKPHKK